MILIVFLTGRAFCAWMCPIPLLTGFFKTKRQHEKDAAERIRAGYIARENYENDLEMGRRKVGIDSRHIVLCGALGATAIFGFPVFCVVCPIGLTFAIIIGLVRLMGFNEPSWSLIVFAVVLVLELVFLRTWCARICPVGALLSLVSKLNRTFRPQIDERKCLRYTSHELCGTCASSCPEHIDPHSDKGLVSISECTRCGKCSEVCPEGVISFPFVGTDISREGRVTERDEMDSLNITKG